MLLLSSSDAAGLTEVPGALSKPAIPWPDVYLLAYPSTAQDLETVELGTGDGGSFVNCA